MEDLLAMLAATEPSLWEPRSSRRQKRRPPGRLKVLLQRHGSPPPMEPASFNLGTVLLATSGLFCLATLYFGTRGGYYDTDDYDGNGTAH
jgi:hypothetical protein